MRTRSVARGVAAACALALSPVCFTAIALAGPPQNAADVTVSITPPAGTYVSVPGQYRIDVANRGNKQADAVVLTIALPRTNTTPVHVLGALGAYDSRCARSATSLVCPLGSLRKNASTVVRFTIELPQSSAPLVVTATVVTSSVESSTTNNVDGDTAFLLHADTIVALGDDAHVEHCTGTALTSFYECELFPSSISFHDFEIVSPTHLAFLNAPASYWGTWDQNDGDHRLKLEYYDGASHEATFDGWAVGNDCFEGVTTFYPPSQYVAPYKVCLQ